MSDLGDWLEKLNDMREVRGVWAELAQLLDDEYMAYDDEPPSETYNIDGKEISQKAVESVLAVLKGHVDDMDEEIEKIENIKVPEGK
jgi:hypothetical protein